MVKSGAGEMQYRERPGTHETYMAGLQARVGAQFNALVAALPEQHQQGVKQQLANGGDGSYRRFVERLRAEAAAILSTPERTGKPYTPNLTAIVREYFC